MTGAPRDAYAGSNYVIVSMDAVRALDGSWEAAGCFQRIAWRCERDGEWRATMEQIATEIGVSVRTAKRITTRLREVGWVAAERRDPQVPTLTWTVVWAEGQTGTPGEGQTGTHDLTSESATVAPGDGSDAKALSEGQNGTQESANLAPTSTKTETPEQDTPTASQSDASKRGTRLPADWSPDETLKQWFREQPFAHVINPVTETQKFIDYWIAAPGQRGVKLDWTATWRNWMRQAAERAAGNVRSIENRHNVAPDNPDRIARAAIMDGKPDPRASAQ